MEPRHEVSPPTASLPPSTEFCENLSADCRENVIMTQILPCIKVTGTWREEWGRLEPAKKKGEMGL